jgi:hypothetical protein
MIHLHSTGLVYRNPFPNIRSLHAFFPSVLETRPGRLLVCFDRGSAMENRDVRSVWASSEDGGARWSEPVEFPFWRNLPETVSVSSRMSRSGEGALYLLITEFHRQHPEEGLANPETDGFVRTEFLVSRSSDEGESWTEPVRVEPPLAWDRYETCSPLTCLDENRLLFPTAIWPNWEGERPFGMKAIAFRSKDAGRTWTDTVTVLDDGANRIASWEQKQAVLSDGRVLAVCWAHDLKTGKSLKNRYTFSEDGGETFHPWVESPLQGETCTPLSLPDNRVLFLYRRTDRRGLWAHLARFEGTEWVPLNDAPVWGTSEASYSGTSEKTFEQLSTLRFGYPQACLLSDGDIFCVFWCVEECVANIRWARLRVG